MVHTDLNEVQLYLRPNTPLAVLEGSDLAFKCTFHETMALLKAGAIECRSYRDRITKLIRITHAVLKVSRQAAQRIITPLGIVRTSANITKARQSNGAKHWVTRLDRAECGIGGGSSRVVFPMSIPHYRLGTGKTDKPASQVA